MAFSIMPAGGTAAGAANCYQLEGRLEFDTAADALSAISAKIAESAAESAAESNGLELNLSGITAANSAGLAVLIECKSIALQTSKSVSFKDIPDSLQKIAEVCQVQDLLA